MEGDGGNSGTPPPPPPPVDAVEIVVEAPPVEHHFPAGEADLVQITSASGGYEWKVVLHRPAEKPEPVRDESGQDE